MTTVEQSAARVLEKQQTHLPQMHVDLNNEEQRRRTIYQLNLPHLGSDALNVTDNLTSKRTICAALDVAMEHGMGSINTGLVL